MENVINNENIQAEQILNIAIALTLLPILVEVFMIQLDDFKEMMQQMEAIKQYPKYAMDYK